MTTAETQFSWVLYERKAQWFAVCLERYLMTYADNLPDVVRDVFRAMHEQVQIDREGGIVPFSRLPRAPERFQEMLKRSHPIDPTELLGTEPYAAFDVPIALMQSHAGA